jgi:serine/threonine-protein kinase
MAANAADRDLLFGLLALQNGLIDQVQLVAAFHAWTRDKGRPLAEHLVARGDLDADQRACVDAMVALHVKIHGGDPAKSLAAIPAGRSTHESLARLGDPDIEGTLAQVRPPSTHHDGEADADRTTSYSMGSATSNGQRFRLLRPHARGGLGEVFVALDAELHREVALKQILERHADDPVSRQRFVAEAEITGGLEHPGVVPVYGLGTHGGGRPYYAMRFIRGDSLKETIEHFHGDGTLKNDPGRRSLELRKLLRRFLDVCNAIEYAHSRGVIHRDLKPANIILGRHGETLVVDWGLAKVVGRADPSVGEQTIAPSSSGSSETLPGSALGTPAYMSPEQARGDLSRLGPRSDVYCLGATLYCLLTGRPPFEGEDVGAILKAVQEGRFPRPSRFEPALDKALEAVCLKAMAGVPEDRYRTPRALADDLDRWMAEEPVDAWPEPFARRARRWARRHRTAVTSLVASMLVALIGTATVLTVQTHANGRLEQANRDLTRANDRATKANEDLISANEREKQRFDLAVEAIKLFHGDVSEDLLLKEKQFEGLRSRLLNGAANFYGRLEGLLKGQTDRESRAELGKAYEDLGELTGKIGDQPAALAVHRKALAVRRGLASEPGADAGTRLDVARSLNAAGHMQSVTGDRAGARTSFEEAKRLAEEAEAQDGAVEEARKVMGTAYHRLAVVLLDTGDPAGAQVANDKALAIFRKLADDNPSVTEFQLALADSYNSIGVVLSQTGNLTGARAAYGNALTIRQRLADANLGVARFQRALAASHGDIGLLLRGMSDMSGARAAFGQALTIFQKLADAYPNITQIQRDLAATHGNIGFVLSETNDLSGARVAYGKSKSIYERLVGDNPSVTDFQQYLAHSHANLGNLLYETGDSSGAQAAFDKALTIQQKLVDANPNVPMIRQQLARSYNSLGEVLSAAGDTTGALVAHGKALVIQQTLAASNPSITLYEQSLAWSQHAIGLLLLENGDMAGALTAHGRALDTYQKLANANPKIPEFRNGMAVSHGETADVRRRLGRNAEARKEYDRAIELFEQLVRDNPEVTDHSSLLARSLRGRGLARRELADVAGAAADTRRALGIWDSLASRSGLDWYYTACCHAALGGLAGRDGSSVSVAEAVTEADAAIALLRKAIAMDYRAVSAYRTEDALDPLRSRDDFRLLMMDLEFPSDPFAPDTGAHR